MWNLFGDMTGQVYRSWNTCVKLSWSLPRSSHNYFVDGLAGSLPSVKKKILCQYVTFLQNLSSSVRREVRIMSRIFSHDLPSVTGRNLASIGNLFNLDPRRDPSAAFKANMIVWNPCNWWIEASNTFWCSIFTSKTPTINFYFHWLLEYWKEVKFFFFFLSGGNV